MVDDSEKPEIDDKSVFDKEEALSIIQDDEEFLKELAEMFLEDCHSQLSKIEEAVVTGNSNGLRESAHKLKGSVGNFGKNTVFKTVFELENMGNEGKMGDVENTFNVLVKEMEYLVKALKEYIG